MKAPNQLKTLDDLMTKAGEYAEFCLRKSGAMAPALFLIGVDGPMVFVPDRMADANDKDNFANMARLVCIAYNASACVMVLEAWLKLAKPGENLDLTEPPSEAFDRQEVIVIVGEDRSAQRQQFLSIVRSGNGRFFNLTEAEVPAPDNMTGRFANILPPNVPDEEMQTLAKTMLTVRGSKTVYLSNHGRNRS